MQSYTGKQKHKAIEPVRYGRQERHRNLNMSNVAVLYDRLRSAEAPSRNDEKEFNRADGKLRREGPSVFVRETLEGARQRRAQKRGVRCAEELDRLRSRTKESNELRPANVLSLGCRTAKRASPSLTASRRAASLINRDEPERRICQRRRRSNLRSQHHSKHRQLHILSDQRGRRTATPRNKDS